MLLFLLACVSRPAPQSLAPLEVDWHCSYDNPYSDEAECREYAGRWTEGAAEEACGEIFKGVSGELGSGACPRREDIGTCTAESEGAVTRIWFYGGEAGTVGRMCRLFFRGEWVPSGGAEPAPAAAGEAGLKSFQLEASLLSSDERVVVEPSCLDESCLLRLLEERSGIRVAPAGAQPFAGLIFYPGAKVDPRSYLPLARGLAEGGMEVILLPMPDGYAVSGFDRAADILAARPDQPHWFLGGHSMGGVMTAHFRRTHPEHSLAGLVIGAAYVDGQDSLQEETLPVLSLYGTRDAIVTPEEILEGRAQLPPHAELLPLRGGNHAQFGSYGSQEDDGVAAITAERQQDLIRAAILHFARRSLGESPPPPEQLEELSVLGETWCEEAQRILTGMSDRSKSLTLRAEPYEDGIAFGQSKALLEGGVLSLPSMLLDGGNDAVLSMPSVYPRELACKLKTGDFLSRAAGIPQEESSCASVNRALVDRVLESLPAATVQAYRASSSSLEFSEDADQATGLDWLTTDTLEVSSPGGLQVTAPRLRVGQDDSLPEAAQEVVYCKLWTPSRALEWILSQVQSREEGAR